MARTSRSPGGVLELASPDDVLSGDVVVFERQITVAINDYADGEVGQFATIGLFQVPAVDGAEFVAGQPVVYDVSEAAFDDHSATPAEDDITGGAIAVESKTAAASDTVLVLLNAAFGTITPAPDPG
jgi:predicted RecA/RadA family phage recombinase